MGPSSALTFHIRHQLNSSPLISCRIARISPTPQAAKARFLGVIESGILTHEMMESENTRVRIYGNAAIVTALTTTKGKFGGQVFTTLERATDVFVKQNGRWLCALSQLTRFTKK